MAASRKTLVSLAGCLGALASLGVLMAGPTSCSKPDQPAEEAASAPLGAAESVRDKVLPRLSPQAPGMIDSRNSGEGLFPLRRENTPTLDIRGLGDSAFTGNQSPQAPAPAFDAALDRLNREGLLYRGDLNVVNWESVVGESCQRYGEGFGFLTSPRAVAQAFAKGLNVFALSNNHARDCDRTPEAGAVGDGGAGEITTAQNMKVLEERLGLVWSGISASGTKSYVVTRLIQEGGQSFRLAYASIDLGRDSCARSLCYADRYKVAAALKAADADVRIVSFHAREWLGFLSDSENRAQLDKIPEAAKLFIEQGSADVVFGTGPHIAMPVRVLRKSSGGLGVAFLSLGNFIHPLLSPQSPNLVGRVLFDLNRKAPVQVQALMVRASGAEARAFDFDPSSPFVGGTPWRVDKDPSTGLSVGYFNLNMQD